MLLINPQAVLKALLAQEDLDENFRITIEDNGPKSFKIQTINGKEVTVCGAYFLSNLLQELVFLIEKGNVTKGEILLEKIEELPSRRISRMIKERYWDDLTRTLDEKGLKKVIFDEKVQQDNLYIYVPEGDKDALEYYQRLAKTTPNLKVVSLPKNITPTYVKSINDKPGVLSLALSKSGAELQGEPYVVPGGRFNEMYGWDSYFESVGLLIDGRKDLVKGMIENFEYQIIHYGKILNANRSYYLTRTQPPFYSSMIKEYITSQEQLDINWLRAKLEVLIKEYETVWMVPGKREVSNGLNRYYAEGLGFVYETEPGHFKEVIEKFATSYKMEEEDFETQYKSGLISCPELDTYFTHDRSLRESGHDTTKRFVAKCADLNTVDLNSLLYKYEQDIAFLISEYYAGELTLSNGKIYEAEYFVDKANSRQKSIDKLLWNQEKGMYFDFNFVGNTQTDFVSASMLYPLWAKCCSVSQADLLVKNVLPLLLCKGGIASSTEASRGRIDDENPQRQWDYPYGWAPHQMIIWRGLLNYGYEAQVQEYVYRWLWLITTNAMDYSGTIAEKYDVVNCTHKVNTEYGNVGTNFECYPDGGFGWMNASYKLGLELLESELQEKLDLRIDPDILF